MMSRALQRLDAAISASTNPIEASCLRAERAGWLGRQGQFDVARSTLLEIRASQETVSHPAVAAWICLAEGLIEHHSHYAVGARDRIRRAYALSSAARLRPLIALSAAWVSHLDYLYGDLQGFARHVAEALQEAAEDHHAARSRASLAVASAFHWCGRLDLAQPWYLRARQHAMAEGDQIAMSAMMFNRAWISGHQARLDSLFAASGSMPDAAAIRQLVLAAESADHFDQHLGKTSQRSQMRLLCTQLAMLRGEHAEALKRYEVQIPKALEEGMGYLLPVFRADTAWCHLQLGSTEEAKGDALAAEAALSDECEDEDRAIAHGRLASVYRGLDLQAQSARHDEGARACLQALQRKQARMLELLESALSQVPGLR